MRTQKFFHVVLFSIGVLLSSAVLATAQAADPDPQSPWMTDYAKALELAKAQNKVVLLDFTGSDWCSACMRMKADVLDRPQFLHYAQENLILVELDFPQQKPLPVKLARQNQQLARQFGVRGLPIFVLVDKEGKELGRHVGYLGGGPAAFIKKLNTFYSPVPAAAR